MPKSETALLQSAAAALVYLRRPRTRHQLAAHLEIGPVSAHRLLAAMMSLGWVRIVGEVETGKVGAPARLYKAAVTISTRR